MAGARVVYYEDETGRRAACLPETKRGGRLTIRQRMRACCGRWPRGANNPDAEPRGPGLLYFSWLEMLLNIVFRLVPMRLTAAMIATKFQLQ